MKRKATDRRNFTKRLIEGIPTPPKKRTIIYDSQTRGLGVVVQPGSGNRSYFWFRKVASVPTWRTIGSCNDLSVEQARNFAANWNSKLAVWRASDYSGPGPLEDRRDVTLSELVDDYCAKHLQANAKVPEKAIEYCRWQINTYVPQWKERKLNSIRREHVRQLQSNLAEVNGQVTSNRTVQLVRTLFNFAKREELFHGDNPAQGVTPFREQSRTRFLAPDELQRLFSALKREPSKDLSDFVLLSLLCGARRSDTLEMRWEQLDLTEGRATWTIPNPKNQQSYVVPLMDEAVQILKRRRKDSEWVFPGVGESNHIVDLKRPWAALLARAKIENLRIHDLRRSLGSWMAGAGASLPIIGRALGHQSGEATAIYARLSLDPVRESIATATTAMLAAAAAKPKPTKRQLLKA
jgi:integrase